MLKIFCIFLKQRKNTHMKEGRHRENKGDKEKNEMLTALRSLPLLSGASTLPRCCLEQARVLRELSPFFLTHGCL
jgi:hypothetical protein